VSPRYAEEIQTPEFGGGLDGLLRHRASALSGIINGIDDTIWNPSKDIHINTHYNRRHLEGKIRNKLVLQREFKLPENPHAMLIGFIGRMVEQKGMDLILQLLPRLQKQPVQIAILGSGEKRFQEPLAQWAAKHPAQLGLRLGYDEGLAHRIEAGADVFLMPSRFEPCGLNQLYSLRYGTVPIVHSVGGLADTVVDASEASLLEGTATGFCFDQPEVDELEKAVTRALDLFADQAAWQRLMMTGMQQNFTWRESAQEYLKLYEAALNAR
jgi:starch synthase